MSKNYIKMSQRRGIHRRRRRKKTRMKRSKKAVK